MSAAARDAPRAAYATAAPFGRSATISRALSCAIRISPAIMRMVVVGMWLYSGMLSTRASSHVLFGTASTAEPANAGCL